MAARPDQPLIAGRCYCGASRFTASAPPEAVTYCHCSDCRRVTGAPVAAFAAFDEDDLTFTSGWGRAVSANPGVTRTFCPECGSPLTGRYAYLPGTVYISVGLIDQADDYAPEMHAHHDNKLTWLCLEDELARHTGSARDSLNAQVTGGQVTGGQITDTQVTDTHVADDQIARG